MQRPAMAGPMLACPAELGSNCGSSGARAMAEDDLAAAIPPDLERAFMETVWGYSDWGFEGPEPEVSIERQRFTLSAVCRFVSKFDAPMPNVIYSKLLSVIDATHAELAEQLTNNRSYASGALCLLKLIDDREAEYRRQEEWRRNN
jgi:hypothetical protein